MKVTVSKVGDPKTGDKPKKKSNVAGYESPVWGGRGDKRGFSNTTEGNYSGNVAPRVGGKAPKSSGMAKGTSSKKVMNKAKRTVKNSAGSRQAKAAALLNLKK